MRLQEKRSHTDIDFFVPLHPFRLDEFYNVEDSTKTARDDFFTLLTTRILPIFNSFSVHVLGKGSLVPVRFGPAAHYNHYRILDMQFSDNVGGTKYQFIVLTSLPRDNTQGWDAYVVDEFDIDIVKNRVDVGEDLLPLVRFVDPAAQASIASGGFTYTVPPHYSFQDSLKRLQKYMNRGFTLKRVIYPERMTETEKTQWMDGFRSHVAHPAATQILRESLREECAVNSLGNGHSDLLEAFSCNVNIGRLIQSFIA